MIDNSRHEKVVEICRNLIRIKSYSGEEKLLANALESTMRELGFDEIIIDKYGSIIGKIKGNMSGEKILFDGHIDTVPVPDPSRWKYDPFGGIVDNGKIYGRGATDMKGAVAAMVCAAGFYAQDIKKNFAGEIIVAGVVHEECFEGIAARNISNMIKPDYVVIGEASSLNLKRGQRGRAEIIIETFGTPAHSANPETGNNAIYQMSTVIEEIKKLQFEENDFLGKGILVITDIKSSPYPGASVVPDYCKITCDRRLLVGETKEDVLNQINNIVNRLKDIHSELDVKVSYSEGTEKCHTGEIIEAERFFPAWLIEEGDIYVKKTLKGLRKAGLEPEITNYSFCTNGSHYAGEAGIKTIGFGPSRENLAHTIDEYIEIEQLIGSCRGYYGIMQSIFEKADNGD